MATPSLSRPARPGSLQRTGRTGRTGPARGDRAVSAEVLYPGQQLVLRFDLRDLPERLVEAIRVGRSWGALRHWAALQGLFPSVGYGGRIRWTLDDHLAALGCAAALRRDPRVRAAAAAEVEALCALEIALYHPDGTLRVRGPVLVVTQRWEAREGEAWSLEGLELILHPVLYEGARQPDGTLRRLWAPAPVALARLDAARHPYALRLGLMLPFHGRWDLAAERRPVVLTGAQLLAAAGLALDRRRPERTWVTLARNLAALRQVGGVGDVAWEPADAPGLTSVCRLHPPPWEPPPALGRVPVNAVEDVTREIPAAIPADPGVAARPAEAQVLTGAVLVAWRKARGWTQVEAARQLGVSERTVRGAEATPDRPLGRALRAAFARLG